MVQENFDFLKNQVKFTGFGEGLENPLRARMEKGEDEFTLNHKMEYGNDKLDATLHFSKSSEKDMYFFNKYDLAVKKEGEEKSMKQSFLVSHKHTTYTAKEAYNLMSGRAVNKDMAALQKVTDGDKARYKPTGNRYNAWVELDFNDADKYGNFKQKIYSAPDKLDVAKALEGQPISELQNADTTKWLVDSLHKGNRREVTFIEDGNERKAFLQADPKNVAIRQFDTDGTELQPLKAAETQSEKQSETEQGAGQKNGQSQGVESNKSEKQNEQPGKKEDKTEDEKKSRRRGARIS